MYVTVAAMIDKFGERELIQLTDTEAPYLDAINLTKLNAAIEEANSEIDAYIGSRYALPLQTVPPFLKNIGCNLARYYAVTGDLSENDPIQDRYKNSLKTLERVSKGVLTLGGSPAGEATAVNTANNNVMMQVGRRHFGGSNW